MLPSYLLMCGLATVSASFEEFLHLEASAAEKWSIEKMDCSELDENAPVKSNNTNAAINKITEDAFSYLDALDKEMAAKGEIHEAIDENLDNCLYLNEDFVMETNFETPIIIDCNYHAEVMRSQNWTVEDQMDFIFEDQNDVVVDDRKADKDDGLPEGEKMEAKEGVKNMDHMFPEILICDYAKYPVKEGEGLKFVGVGGKKEAKRDEKEEGGNNEEGQKDVDFDDKKDVIADDKKEKAAVMPCMEYNVGLILVDNTTDVNVETLHVVKKAVVEKEKGGEQAVEMPCQRYEYECTRILIYTEEDVSVEDSDHVADDEIVKDTAKVVVEKEEKEKIVGDKANKGMDEGAVKAQKAVQKGQAGDIDCSYLDENYVQ